MLKLSDKFQQPKQITKLRRLLATFSSSLDVELQQRSVEYYLLAGDELKDLRPSLLDRMPLLSAQTIKARVEDLAGKVEVDEELEEGEIAGTGVDLVEGQEDVAKDNAPTTVEGSLLDLDGLFDSSQGGTDSPLTDGGDGGGGSGDVDLLGDLFGGGSTPPPPAAAPAPAPAPSHASFPSGSGTPPAVPSPQVSAKQWCCYLLPVLVHLTPFVLSARR